jgi:hypothetical protein
MTLPVLLPSTLSGRFHFRTNASSIFHGAAQQGFEGFDNGFKRPFFTVSMISPSGGDRNGYREHAGTLSSKYLAVE